MNDTTKERLDEIASHLEEHTRRFGYATGLAIHGAAEGNVDLVEMVQADLERTYVLARDAMREQCDLALRISQQDELAARRLRKQVFVEPHADPYGETADVPAVPWAQGEG